jgi:hypothetical protein
LVVIREEFIVKTTIRATPTLTLPTRGEGMPARIGRQR